MNDLLLTSDMDVLHAALFVLLRPAQQYNTGMPFEPGQGAKLSQRLLTFAKGWEKFPSRGLDLVTLASSEEIPLPEDMRLLQLHFYPLPKAANDTNPETPERRSPTTQTEHYIEGPVSVNLDVNESFDEVHDRLTLLAKENRISIEDQLIALNKVRLVIMMMNEETRRKMISIRLLSLATYGELNACV